MHTRWAVLVAVNTIFARPTRSVAIGTMPPSLADAFSVLIIAGPIVLAVTPLCARFTIIPTGTSRFTANT